MADPRVFGTSTCRLTPDGDVEVGNDGDGSAAATEADSRASPSTFNVVAASRSVATFEGATPVLNDSVARAGAVSILVGCPGSPSEVAAETLRAGISPVLTRARLAS